MEFKIGLLCYLTILIYRIHPVKSQISFNCTTDFFGSRICKIQNFETNLNALFENENKTSIDNIIIEKSSVDRFPALVLDEMPNLKVVRMANISLKLLDPTVFGGPNSNNQKLTKIDEINLDSNELMSIGPASFSRTAGLERLDLSNNKIGAIDELAFDGLTKLRFLELSKNSLSYLHVNTFSKLALVQRIELGNNRFQTFNLDIFLQNVNSLHAGLSNNILTTIQSSETNENFNGINLKSNDLMDISALDKMKKIQRLFLSGNKHLLLNENTFINMPHLYWLEMNDVNLNKLNNDYSLFAPLQKLQYINLNQNDLVSINELPQLAELTQLDVEDNKLTDIDGDRLKEKFPKLVYLDIKGNKWNCDYLKTLFEKLKSLKFFLVKSIFQPDELQMSDVTCEQLQARTASPVNQNNK